MLGLHRNIVEEEDSGDIFSVNSNYLVNLLYSDFVDMIHFSSNLAVFAPMSKEKSVWNRSVTKCIQINLGYCLRVKDNAILSILLYMEFHLLLWY